MFFSILIPVYNTSEYLEECMESVLSQTFKDFEVVLVNDGSSDNSPSICDEFAKKDHRVRVIHKQNEGLMMTRRRGFKEAKGDYFICVDSDDKLYDEGALELIHKIIIEKNCDLVIYDYICGAGGGNPERRRVALDCDDGFVFEGDNKSELYERLLTTNGINSICTKCPSRNIVDIDTDYSVWKEEICRAEDYFQSIPILDKAKRIGYVKKPLYYYRWSQASISNNIKFKYYRALRCIDNRADKYIENWNLTEQLKQRALGQRIVGISEVVCGSYFVSKRNKKVRDWKAFAKEIAEDPYFIGILNGCNRKSVLAYYRILHFLIVHKKVNLAIWVIESVSFISKLKHSK